MRQISLGEPAHHMVQRSMYNPELVRRVDAKRRAAVGGSYQCSPPRVVHPTRALGSREIGEPHVWHICAYYRHLSLERAKPWASHIKRWTALEHGVSEAEMDSSDRTRRVTRPRQLAMARIKHLRDDLSLPQIGKMFGGKDHTTVLHAIKAVERRANESL